MKRGAFHTSLFVESEDMANEIYTANEEHPIASPIYPAPQASFEELESSSKERFPYRQIIRGDGACYLNACLVGILNKCVNDQKKWEKFKANIKKIYPGVADLIDEIERTAKADNGNFLDRHKLNAILQVRGNQNLCTRLAKAILIPKHQELIAYYDLEIADLEDRIKESERRLESNADNEVKKSEIHLIERTYRFLRIYEASKKNISSAGSKDFASSYEEARLEPYVKELTEGMGENGQSLSIITMVGDSIDNPDIQVELDCNSIYLYNHVGAHFNLWYSKLDPICHEINPQKYQNPDSKLEISCDSKNNIIKFRTISPDNHDTKFDYNKKLEDGETYDSKNYTKKKEQEKILQMLREAKDATLASFESGKLNDNFFIAVMKVASQNRGIASIDEQKFNQDFDKALKEIDPTLAIANYDHQRLSAHEIAKFFSANFQILSKQENYLTAREGVNGKINQTGRRLFRVCTQENIEKFQQSLGRGTPHTLISGSSTSHASRLALGLASGLRAVLGARWSP